MSPWLDMSQLKHKVLSCVIEEPPLWSLLVHIYLNISLYLFIITHIKRWWRTVTAEQFCLLNSKWGKETFKREARRERGGVFSTSSEFKGESVSDWLRHTPPPFPQHSLHFGSSKWEIKQFCSCSSENCVVYECKWINLLQHWTRGIGLD